MDNLKAKGLRDRSFEILCLVGKPEHNIKDVSDKCNEQLKNELEKTRKILFACRTLHHGAAINDVSLNIFNREAELTKPLIRLVQNSLGVLKELLPALTKCLDAKRKVKSTSLEAILYTAIINLTPAHGLTIDNESIVVEVKRITDGVDKTSNSYSIDHPISRAIYYIASSGGCPFPIVTFVADVLKPSELPPAIRTNIYSQKHKKHQKKYLYNGSRILKGEVFFYIRCCCGLIHNSDSQR